MYNASANNYNNFKPNYEERRKHKEIHTAFCDVHIPKVF
jgi:hypothetical protein